MPNKTIQKKHYSDEMSDLEVWQQLKLRANEVANHLQWLTDSEQKRAREQFIIAVGNAKKGQTGDEQRNNFKLLILKCDKDPLLSQFDIRKNIIKKLTSLKASFEETYGTPPYNDDHIILKGFLEAVEKKRLIDEALSTLKAQAVIPYDESMSGNLYNTLEILRTEWAKQEPTRNMFARFRRKSNVIDVLIGQVQQVCSIKKGGPVTLTKESLGENSLSAVEEKIRSSSSEQRNLLIGESVVSATTQFTSGFARYSSEVDSLTLKQFRFESLGYTDSAGRPVLETVALNPEEISNTVLYNNMMAQQAFNSAIDEVKEIVKVLVSIGEPFSQISQRIVLPDQAFRLAGASGLNLLNLLNDKDMGLILKEDKRTTQAIKEWCESSVAATTLIALYSKNKNLDKLKTALQEGNKSDPLLSAQLSALLKGRLKVVIKESGDKNEKKAAKNVLTEVEKIEKALLNEKKKSLILAARSSTERLGRTSLLSSRPSKQDQVNTAAIKPSNTRIPK